MCSFYICLKIFFIFDKDYYILEECRLKDSFYTLEKVFDNRDFSFSCHKKLSLAYPVNSSNK